MVVEHQLVNDRKSFQLKIFQQHWLRFGFVRHFKERKYTLSANRYNPNKPNKCSALMLCSAPVATPVHFSHEIASVFVEQSQ